MMPDWLQVLYAVVIVCMLPFCAWVATQVQKNRISLTKLERDLINMEKDNASRKAYIDERLRLERLDHGAVTQSLGRLERNIVRIGTKMELGLESIDE